MVILDANERSHVPLVVSPATRSILPIHTIPAELLQHIFALGRDAQLARTGSEKERDPQDLEQGFEVLVSHVCSHWRTVALSNPSLWTTLHFKDASHIPRGAIYVVRSRNQPLDLIIDTPTLDNQMTGITLTRKDIAAVADIFIPVSHRLRSLRLVYRDEFCKDVVCARISNGPPAPLLESIEIYYFEDWKNPQRPYVCCPNTVIFAGVTPRVKHVSIIGAAMPWLESRCYMKNLSSLELKLHAHHIRPSFDVWKAIIGDNPGLERLSLHYSGPREDDEWTGTPISIPSLRELELSDMGNEYLIRFFDFHSTPGVKTLRLELDGEDYTPAIQRITKPDAPVLPMLEHLSLMALQCSPAALMQFAIASTSLRLADVDCRHFPSEMLVSMLQIARETLGETTTSLTIPPALREVKIAGLDSPTLATLIEHTRGVKHSVPLRWVLGTSSKGPELNKTLLERSDDVVFFDDQDGSYDGDDDDEYESSDSDDYDNGPLLDVANDQEVLDIWAGALQLPPGGPIYLNSHSAATPA